MTFKDKKMTRIASHRGGTLEFGDSTAAGFRATAAMALDEVEFDLHPTLDGEIFVHHDPTLDRTTDTSGAICEMTAAAVRRAVIDYSAGQSPITFDELCDIYAGSAVNFRCEIKPGPGGRVYENFVPRVIDTLRRKNMLDRTVFSSFLIRSLDELATNTDRPCLWLVSPAVQVQLGIDAVAELARAHGIPEIGVNIDHADAGTMARVTGAGLDFGCWAAHSAAQIGKALDLGVKVFTTDRPSLAIALRRGARAEAAE
jgi:glycerophosphoryl diester phosphodiesterase